jgi:hypothetical protein
MIDGNERTVEVPISAAEGFGPPRSRTTSWHDPAATAAVATGMSGREFVEALAAGRIPPPPMASLFGFQVTGVAEAEVRDPSGTIVGTATSSLLIG